MSMREWNKHVSFIINEMIISKNVRIVRELFFKCWMCEKDRKGRMSCDDWIMDIMKELYVIVINKYYNSMRRHFFTPFGWLTSILHIHIRTWCQHIITVKINQVCSINQDHWSTVGLNNSQLTVQILVK